MREVRAGVFGRKSPVKRVAPSACSVQGHRVWYVTATPAFARVMPQDSNVPVTEMPACARLASPLLSHSSVLPQLRRNPIIYSTTGSSRLGRQRQSQCLC